MSLRSEKSKRESCAYRLNRAALMRMEEGRRKAMTRNEGYYDNRAVCIQLERRRSSNIYPGQSRSQSQSQNEESRSEDESPLSEATVALRKILKRHKTRKKENSSVTAYTPNMNTIIKRKGQSSTDKKMRSGHKRKPSNARYKEPEFEVQALNVRRILTEDSHKRRRKTKRIPQTTDSESTIQQSSSEPRDKRPLRQKAKPSTSPSSIRQLQQGADTPPESNTVCNQANLTCASSPQPYVLKCDNKQKNEEEKAYTKSDLGDSIKVEPLAAEKGPKPGSPLSNRIIKGISFLNPKNPFDDSFLFKKLKLSDELHKNLEGSKKISPVDVSSVSTVATESHESVEKQSKGRRGGKRSGVVRPGSASRKVLLKPLVSNVTVTSDQEEVISKWRKRLGTASPPAKDLPNIPSSFLRDSQVLTVQGTPDNDAYFNPMVTDYLIPEKDSADLSIDNAEFRKSLKPLTGKHSNEVFSAREEKELYVRMEIEKTKKHIHYLEELAREKIRKLETIRWKKKRALEEEAELNEKLEKLLYKIQELRESDSYARLFDKQTQVFSARKNRPNIK